MGRPHNSAVQVQQSIKLQQVYDQYSGMLYGYLLMVLKDKGQAEKILVDIFDDIAKSLDENGNCDPDTWCGLYRMAKTKVIQHVGDDGNSNDQDMMVYTLGNNMYNGMTDEQKQVFYEAYYGGKKVTQLAQQLNKSEDSIKETLKEAFVILRRGGN